MIEKHQINGRDRWIKIDPHPVERDNPNTIPREYFTVTCHDSDPTGTVASGERIMDDEGRPRLFESPVAAITAARKYLEKAATVTREPVTDAETEATQQAQKDTD